MARPILLVFSALGLVAACASPPRTTRAPERSHAASSATKTDPRDVTREGDPPPRYRPGSDAPLAPITTNRYGAYSDAPTAPQLGDTIADFELPLVRGGTFSFDEARARGKLVIVFYRGFW